MLLFSMWYFGANEYGFLYKGNLYGEPINYYKAIHKNMVFFRFIYISTLWWYSGYNE